MTTRTPFATLLALSLTAALPAQEGQSTFGLARTRAQAALGRLPRAGDVVVRDIVNYHRHRLPLPTRDQAVAFDLRIDRSGPGDGRTCWLQLGYATLPEGDRALAPPCAVALVVDCSGSMQERGKMSEVHRGLAAFVARLRPDDRVALVGFANEARLVTPLRRRGDGAWLQETVQALQPAGSTNLHAGLMLGVGLLADADLGAASRRVVLLTDGIANTG